MAVAQLVAVAVPLDGQLFQATSVAVRGDSGDVPAVALRPAMRMLIMAVTTPTMPVVAPMIAITIAATSIPLRRSYI